MKQIANPIYVLSINATASFKLLPYLRLVLILVSGLALTNIGLRAFAQSSQLSAAPSNPFLEYADIFPGLSADALTPRTFSCDKVYEYNPPPNLSCHIDLASGIFSRIETTVLDGVIRQTTFTLREDTLKVGNLVLLFGSPIFHIYPRKVFLFWNKLFMIVSTAATGNPAAIRPVWSVTFTDTY